MRLPTNCKISDRMRGTPCQALASMIAKFYAAVNPDMIEHADEIAHAFLHRYASSRAKAENESASSPPTLHLSCRILVRVFFPPLTCIRGRVRVHACIGGRGCIVCTERTS